MERSSPSETGRKGRRDARGAPVCQCSVVARGSYCVQGPRKTAFPRSISSQNGTEGLVDPVCRDHDRPQSDATRGSALFALRKGLLPCLQVPLETVASFVGLSS